MEKVIKNMVCQRCVESVENIADTLDLPIKSVSIGKILFERSLSSKELSEFGNGLQAKGFELINNRSQEIVSRIQSALIDYISIIESQQEPPKLSSYLTEKLHFNYSYLSQVFSKEKGITVERYLIRLKIERVKELLSFDKYTLSEISLKLNYSSVQYLSNQFKSVTGMTVTDFVSLPNPKRVPLDQV
jgi:YesN/AraC family two-component response regulator